MAENIINKDLISLFRGQPMFGQTTNQVLSNYPSEKMLSGRFFTPNLGIAKSYAQNSSFPSVVKEMKVPSNVLNQAYNFKDRLTNFPTKTFADLPQRRDVLVASKDMLKNYKPSINIPATLSSNFNQGLGFFKQNAFRTLAMLGSLPVQTGIMAMAPTTMGNAEITPTQLKSFINQQNESQNYGGSGYEGMSDAASNQERSEGGRGSRYMKGGIVNLYKYGGFI